MNASCKIVGPRRLLQPLQEPSKSENWLLIRYSFCLLDHNFEIFDKKIMLTMVFWLPLYIFHENTTFFFFIDFAMTSVSLYFDFVTSWRNGRPRQFIALVGQACHAY